MKIRFLIKTLSDLGIKMSIDNVRKLEKAGIVFCSHNPKSKYREFTEEQLHKSVRNLCYYHMGASISEIKQNGEVLKARGRKILNVARKLSK